MSDTNIKNALVLGVVAANLGVPTHYENIPNWTTPTNEPWARVQILNLDDEVRTLGTNGRNQRNGLLRITVFTPKGSGVNAAYALVDDIKATFKSGAQLTHNGQVVTINSASTRPSPDEAAWYGRIIDVDFYTFEKR